MAGVNILIVEDEVAIAQDLQDIIEMDGHKVVGIAYSYDKAMELLKAKSPELVFLDIALRGSGSGIDVAKVLKEKYNIPYIFLTSFSDQETINEVVSLNPSGYLIKPFKERDIAPAIALAMASVKLKSSETFPTEVRLNTSLTRPLSPQEYVVLRKIWQGKRNADIANELFVSINTVKTHIVKIYSKLEVKSRAQAINKVLNI